MLPEASQKVCRSSWEKAPAGEWENMLFRYGKKAGIMGTVAAALVFVSFAMLLLCWPELGEQVPMRVSSSGEVLRWGARWELLTAPVIGFAVVMGTFMTAFKFAGRYKDEPAMARLTFERYMRNSMIESIVFVLATGVMLYGAMTGSGIGF